MLSQNLTPESVTSTWSDRAVRYALLASNCTVLTLNSRWRNGSALDFYYMVTCHLKVVGSSPTRSATLCFLPF